MFELSLRFLLGSLNGTEKVGSYLISFLHPRPRPRLAGVAQVSGAERGHAVAVTPVWQRVAFVLLGVGAPHVGDTRRTFQGCSR